MKKTAKIIKYNMDFWELAFQVSWNKVALCDRYYHGLPLYLCMEVLRGGKPQTLAQLCLKAQDADNIYWMQEEEACIESRNTGSSEKASSKKDNKNTSNSKNSNHNQSQTQSLNSRNSTFSAPNKNSSLKDKPKNSISDKLGKNGKLIREEREHHLKEGLCLYCREKGHIAQDCPKSKAAKAHAATVTMESKPDSADSKK